MSAVAAPRWAPLLWLTLCSAAGAIVTGPSLTGAVVSVAALVISIVLALRTLAGMPVPTGRAVLGASLRDRSRRTAVSRQRDPDAAGRPRPRAPSPNPLAG
ncbi:hypothetical protein F4553_007177 [Allocatelliglobosispora scoriae]|uniref:Uncharacterized protein n=1 Tax=Allocatelliglobosispora scoriae TaxID=643052 RepID=A0A841C3M9_9ACTN|nr:DUF6412 domain-containing protein [Allocatelliglobosispora scoriae]MBB5873743.1 hypothetical protein [Allocatelliglobosispora scoriae]